jgi:hypothetical protein
MKLVYESKVFDLFKELAAEVASEVKNRYWQWDYSVQTLSDVRIHIYSQQLFKFNNMF